MSQPPWDKQSPEAACWECKLLRDPKCVALREMNRLIFCLVFEPVDPRFTAFGPEKYFEIKRREEMDRKAAMEHYQRYGEGK